MEITKDLLKQKFKEYNKLYFNNELAMCRFTYMYMRGQFGLYTTNVTPKGERIGHIWISKSIDLDEEMLKQLMIHEMIHHYVHTIEGVSFDGFFCHGRHFVKQINRLKKRFGYEVQICYPFWHFKKDKVYISPPLKIIGFLRNTLHLF